VPKMTYVKVTENTGKRAANNEATEPRVHIG